MYWKCIETNIKLKFENEATIGFKFEVQQICRA